MTLTIEMIGKIKSQAAKDLRIRASGVSIVALYPCNDTFPGYTLSNGRQAPPVTYRMIVDVQYFNKVFRRQALARYGITVNDKIICWAT